ncbi:MAG TPA: ABC transporter permease [Blastocatellia bacterium]|nr:ABC transporter permease [Blastocatellia bacterium]
MRNIIAIYRRELSSYFVSPIAYIVIGVFLAISGLLFYFGTFGERGLLTQVMQVRMQAMQGGSAGDIDVPFIIIQQLMGFAATVSLFMVPMLTMGGYAEERKRGTMEMLMTSPITELQIVLGKFFAGLTLYALLMAPTLIYHLYVARFSDPSFPWRILWSSYLGILLLGAVLISLGLFISSLTESQIIAGVGTFAAALFLWIINAFAPGPGSILGQILQHLSVIQHYEGFTRGVIDTTSLVFYVSFTILCLFLTLQSLNSMRWRRA